MRLFQGEALSRYRRLLFCLLWALSVVATLGWMTPHGHAAGNSLGGTVTDQNGSPFSGVTITLTGSESKTMQTGSDGTFLFDNLITGGNYTITPSKTGYTFAPTSVNFSNLNGSFTSSFSGFPSNTIQFQTGAVSVNETPNVTTKVNLTVTRLDATGSASVNYETTDGSAKERSDYLTAIGKLRFAPGESSKTITIFIVNDSYAETQENFTVALSEAVGGTLGTPSIVTVTINSDETNADGPNPVRDASFDTDFFVRQHYVDFFNREADAPGLAFWKNEIDGCPTTECRQLRKINVSGAFFLSIEFQQTGYLVERIYKTAYGDTVGTSVINGNHQLPVPIVRFKEFLSDTQEIGRGVVVGQPGWETVLENNKQAFTLDFVQRSRFSIAYPTQMTPSEFVDQLYKNAGIVPPPASEKQDAIDEFHGAPNTTDNAARARALRRVADNSSFFAAELNRAFVLMQYFGYLRRDPNGTPDTDHSGYDYWLGKLNQFDGNYVNAEMVRAFIVSDEYIHRFGP